MEGQNRRAGHTQNHDAQNCQFLGEGFLRISHIAAHENCCQLNIACSQLNIACSQAIAENLPFSSRLVAGFPFTWRVSEGGWTKAQSSNETLPQ